MQSANLLWISDAQASPAVDWSDALAHFRVKTANSLVEAHEAVSRDQIDCVLVTGGLPEAAPIDVLELLHGVDALLPVIFYDADMSAMEAVRLVRAGAYHCLGYRDTMDSLCDCLESALEERREREKATERCKTSESWRDRKSVV